jgi:hypothetical protein
LESQEKRELGDDENDVRKMRFRGWRKTATHRDACKLILK